MGKRKKHPKGKSVTVALADFFGMHHGPAIDAGYSSDDEQEENHAWAAERDRQKGASREAVAHGQRRVQTAVLLGEENDYRTNLTANEKVVRSHLEEALSEELIEHEWIEYSIALREEREHAERAKKAPFIQFGTQEMLNRANIADNETKERISFFSGFAAPMNKAKAEEKLAADRKKAAERAKAFEEQTRKKSSLFELVNAPKEQTTPETKQAGGWLSAWLPKR